MSHLIAVLICVASHIVIFFVCIAWTIVLASVCIILGGLARLFCSWVRLPVENGAAEGER